MRFLRTTVPSILAGLMLAAPALAADGVQIVQKITQDSGVRTSRVQLDRTHVRTEMVDPSGAVQVVLFDATRQVLDVINVDRKTYVEYTKDELERMAAQMKDATAMMQAQMAAMPPAQRAQMEGMMAGRGIPGMAAPVKTEYRRNGSDRVGRWTCDKYDGYQNGQKTSELCTVAPAALGLAMSDMEITRQLMEFYAKMAPQSAEQFSAVGRVEEQGFAGYPVRRVMTVMGKQAVMETTEAGHVNLPAGTFDLPPGLTKQDMPGMGTRGVRGPGQRGRAQ